MVTTALFARLSGESGTLAARTASVADYRLVPTEFLAVTLKEYVTPAVNVTVV